MWKYKNHIVAGMGEPVRMRCVFLSQLPLDSVCLVQDLTSLIIFPHQSFGNNNGTCPWGSWEDSMR